MADAGVGDGDLTDFVELPLFGSAAAAAPSGNGASPEPSPYEPETPMPEPPTVKAAGEDGADTEEMPLVEGKQLRLL